MRFTFRSFRPQSRPAAHPSFWQPNATRTVSFRLRLRDAGSPPQDAEAGSSTYGPIVRLQLLPTPPHGDAVTFGYRVLTYSGTDSHRAGKAPSRAHIPRSGSVLRPLSASSRWAKNPDTWWRYSFIFCLFDTLTWPGATRDGRSLRLLGTPGRVCMASHVERRSRLPACGTERNRSGGGCILHPSCPT